MAGMTPVLVTGATGTVGRHVVGQLQQRGAPVRAFVRDPGKARAVLGEEVDLAVGDFGDASSLRAALEGADELFLACSNQPEQVRLETAAIDAAVAAGVRRVVKLSAIGAEIGSSLGFWDWQGRIEAHLSASGLAATVLQPSSYMSNLLAAAPTVRHAGKVFAPADGAKIAMIDPRDVGAAAAAVLTGAGHEGMTYILTGPDALTYSEVAAHLSAVTGRQIDFVDLPDEAAREGMLQAGMPGWLADNLTVLFGLLREGVAAQTTDTVRTLTGKDPRTFAEFARDHAAAFAAPDPPPVLLSRPLHPRV